MKVKDLIKKLKEYDQEATVWLPHENSYYDFTFVSCDQIGDVELGVACGDKMA